ncbi:MAG: site-specific integrase [bacterium]|nr:site-specific integrase [bacterium]
MSKRVPSYRLHKPSGQAVVTINSKDHYLGRHGSKESKAAYKRLIHEWKTAKYSTSFGYSDSVTVAMLAADYLDHCEDHYPKDRCNETEQTRRALKCLTDYLDLPAREFSPLKLKAVRETLLTTKNEYTGKDLSRQYINKQIARIVRMFRWGVENELVTPEVYQALRAVKGLQKGRSTAPEASEIKPVSDEIVDLTIKHCTPVLADMIRLQRLTGMRPGEVTCLTPGMIDRSGDVWIANLPNHKTAWRGKNRAIYFGPQAQAILLKYLLRSADDTLFSPAESEQQRLAKLRESRITPMNQGNRAGYNQASRNGTRKPRKLGSSYTAASYAQAVRHACAKAFPIPKSATKEEARAHRKLRWWSPNRLRHAAATKLRRDYGIEAARVILGHGSVSMTEHYAELDASKAIEIANRYG